MRVRVMPEVPLEQNAVIAQVDKPTRKAEYKADGVRGLMPAVRRIADPGAHFGQRRVAARPEREVIRRQRHGACDERELNATDGPWTKFVPSGQHRSAPPKQNDG